MMMTLISSLLCTFKIFRKAKLNEVYTKNSLSKFMFTRKLKVELMFVSLESIIFVCTQDN